MTNNSSNEHAGYLQKWTNYIKGYQKRWFVLKNGLLSYYRSPDEVDQSCRGKINLKTAEIRTDQVPLNFAVSGVLTFHLRALSEVERQRWVTKLELEKRNAITLEDSEDEDLEISSNNKTDMEGIFNIVKTLEQKMSDLDTREKVTKKHVTSLLSYIHEIEKDLENKDQVTILCKEINNSSTILNVSLAAVIKTCNELIDNTKAHDKRWEKLFNSEQEKRQTLEVMLEQLAQQHREMEKNTFRVLNDSNSSRQKNKKDPNASDSEDSDNEFMDALEEPQWPDVVEKSKSSDSTVKQHVRNGSTDSEGWMKRSISQVNKSSRIRRSRIPDRPNYSLNLWSIMKNCIGKELTKIPMPVNFSEPLSFLQRLTEDFEYYDLLDHAANCNDSCEQMAYVAAFTISSYANTSGHRTGKPFNPLLGETFEADRREDYGWLSIAEQVSHHPPKCAQYVEGRGWRFWQEFTMSSKFRGKYLQIIPLGIAHLEFPETKNHYTWRKVTTTVHNIIVGRLWVDNHGEMDIKNHTTGDLCHLKYSAYSYFSREPPRKVTGVINDVAGETKFVLRGLWDDYIEGAKVLNTTQNREKTVFETGKHRVLWRRQLYPELEKCYNMTKLAIEFNEMEENIAPTDSRYRQDQRAMENADWDKANQIKVKLEEKQRAARRQREAAAAAALAAGKEPEQWKPRWFKQQNDPYSGGDIFMFTNEYWDCKEKKDWSRCPDIYLSEKEMQM
ncbi:DgyrCDS13630 [Dimorphilus gyrociliatus]|uniref:Oxysterol-binding protein n=1 Tax=Dimorphilus gyrociliatus TaxID=2664684 RepID=A0A7I8WB73_9ANNE|nr:DgyrCDS13630 [Dimorphilus gyrociliatus]